MVGSLTSKSLPAGDVPFSDSGEAISWLLFRPIVGIVMGVLIYLMLIAGLFVFADGTNPRTPKLLWVIAFVGGFSDGLFINLLQKLIGSFLPTESQATLDNQQEPKE